MTETTELNNSMLINGITPDGLRKLIQNAVRSELNAFVEAIKPKPDPLIKRHEAAKMLGVSLPTIDKYAKYGILSPRHCGGRVYFAESDVQKFLFNNKKGNQL